MKERDNVSEIPFKTFLPKPPLGPRPRWIWIEERIKELGTAISLRIGTAFPIPSVWVDERNQLLMELDLLMKRGDKNE
jgi:hypothetical protein